MIKDRNMSLPVDYYSRPLIDRAAALEALGLSPVEARLALLGQVARLTAEEFQAPPGLPGEVALRVKRRECAAWWDETWRSLRLSLEMGAPEQHLSILNGMLRRVEGGNSPQRTQRPPRQRLE